MPRIATSFITARYSDLAVLHQRAKKLLGLNDAELAQVLGIKHSALKSYIGGRAPGYKAFAKYGDILRGHAKECEEYANHLSKAVERVRPERPVSSARKAAVVQLKAFIARAESALMEIEAGGKLK